MNFSQHCLSNHSRFFFFFLTLISFFSHSAGCIFAQTSPLELDPSADSIPDLTEKKIEQELPLFQPKKTDDVISRKQNLGDTTISTSRLFYIKGATPKVRNTIAKMAEELRQNIHYELRTKRAENQNKVTNNNRISLYIQGKQGEKISSSPYRIRVHQVEKIGYNLQVYIHRGSGLERKSLRRVLLKSLLLMRTINAGTLKENTPLVHHPWLIDGWLEVFDWRAKRSDRHSYAKLVKNPKIFSYEQLFSLDEKAVKTMDDATRKAYIAASGGLVMSLLKQENGKESMRGVLGEVATYEGDMNDLLKRHFPAVNKSVQGIRIAWLLQLSQMAMKPLTDSYSILETEKKLEEALVFRFSENETSFRELRLEHYEEIAKLEDDIRKPLIKNIARKLVNLNNRAYPEYRPIIIAYATLLNALNEGKTKEMQTVIKNLAFDRSNRKKAAIAARDFTDWYVLNHSTQVHANYQAFTRLQQQFEKEQEKANKDAISTYLDILEKFLR